ncbi:MerR family transcriptional regulator [Williamsia deligens]|uniref:MerR family transcriptional regulator n=1 Tax=Williamsia deligens TaxID=321325 RepID=A0ABW3G330_9NOCA|nr:MerR family transcriptional regulator [Williamsia deligens]MCP2194789.1 DNA-binding transcriptional regulator, MerR family [Williamsia deligens]
MRIGELSEATGTSVRSLRYYEEQGLIRAHRTVGGQRRFDEESAQRVSVIRCLIDSGVPTRDIGEMLPCVHTGVATENTLDRLVEAHTRLTAQIDDLSATRARLEAVIVGVRDNTCTSASIPA